MFAQVKKIFGNHFETKDKHEQEDLRTQYFKTTKDRLFKAVVQLINEDQEMKLLSESTERGEISARLIGKKKGIIVISIISIQPLKTAVDFTINIDSGINSGYSHGKIQQIYAKIGQSFPVLRQDTK